ncbi:hypothetical protein [Pseudoxanthomonas putridarboris]|uniref:Uncharacterized protein n=1 Tax=Pseudoxanthomonas putridarboris TaxID=752605 RepID=A0ABU9J2E4_9GAMM
MKWFAAIFVFAVLGVLSVNAFSGDDLGAGHDNRFIAMMVDLYAWLMGNIGSTATGALFAVCAVGILVLAFLDGRKKEESR